MSDLGTKDALATIAVRDLERAKEFYEGKLGFSPVPSGEKSVVNYRSGKSTFMVYVSEFAGTNKATAATWIVDDAEEVARALKAKGIVFDHYDFLGIMRKVDVNLAWQRKHVMIKDPVRNILAI